MKIFKKLLTLNVLVLVFHWGWLMHFICYNLTANLFSQHQLVFSPDLSDWLSWEALLTLYLLSIFLSPNVGNISQRETIIYYYYYYYYFNLILLLLFLLILLSLLICYHFYLHYLSPTSSKFNCTSLTVIYSGVHTIGEINRPVT